MFNFTYSEAELITEFFSVFDHIPTSKKYMFRVYLSFIAFVCFQFLLLTNDFRFLDENIQILKK